MPEYIPALSPSQGMQQLLPYFEVSRNNSALTALHYCNGGIVNISVIVEDYKYVLKIGLVSQLDEDYHKTSKVRVINATVYNEGDSKEITGYLWDSGMYLDKLHTQSSGSYKTLYNLYRQFDGKVPEHIENCVRIASGFYNTMKFEGVEPALYIDHTKLVDVFVRVNWAELIGEWIVSPLTHPSMVAFPLAHKPKDSYPATYRQAVNRRRSTIREGVVNPSSPMPPTYMDALLSSDMNHEDFIRAFGTILEWTLGPAHSMVIALKNCDYARIDPDAVIAQLAARDDIVDVISRLTGNRNTVPIDPVGLCPRVFLLGFKRDPDFIYRSRKLVMTNQGQLPYTWPAELFGNLAIRPYCTEQKSGAWIRNVYTPKNIPHQIDGERSDRRRRRMVWDSLKPQLASLPQSEEVDSFIGFLKVEDPTQSFGSIHGYDVSRDPGPTVLTNGRGGKVIRLSPWKWSRLLYTHAGIKTAFETSMQYPPLFRDNGTDGVQVVTPICNGTVHYISPPIIQEVIDSTIGLSRDYMSQSGMLAT